MKKPPNFIRQSFSIITVIFLIIIGWSILALSQTTTAKNITMTELIQELEKGKIKKIIVRGNEIRADLKDQGVLITHKEASQGLKDYGITPDKVEIEIKNPDSGAVWVTIISIVLPILLIIAFFYFLTRQARTGSMQALSFGRTTARIFEGKKRVTFNDVAGLKNVKQELIEIVEFLKTPGKFQALGAEIPRGVLLVGASGVGKTLLAKAVAGEAGVPFFSLSASEFVEMFVGVGASRVRDLFAKAKRLAPSVIFIDELDAVGRQRGAGLGGSHDEREQTLNQILVEMDGFETDSKVIVLAATNRPDVLDPALLRPGRFDRKIMLDLPDREERLEILQLHTRNKPVAQDVKLEEIARSTPGLSGADLRNIVNEAAIFAARQNQKTINQSNFRQSLEKVMLGPERSGRVLTEKERKIVAYHEAGHAIIGHILPECDEVHKVSIVSRGMALGFTLSLPQEERRLISKTKFIQEITQLLDGRAAEQLIFGEITTGAHNDLDRATSIARNMVMVYGMSEIGPIKLGEREEMVFLGRELGMHRANSEVLSAKIDSEISGIINQAWQKALEILKAELKVLHQFAEELLKEEILEDDDLKRILGQLKPETV